MSHAESPLRRQLYPLLIALSAALVAGHILAYATASPTHGDNDRSRWDTIRALVEESMREQPRARSDQSQRQQDQAGKLQL